MFTAPQHEIIIGTGLLRVEDSNEGRAHVEVVRIVGILLVVLLATLCWVTN